MPAVNYRFRADIDRPLRLRRSVAACTYVYASTLSILLLLEFLRRLRSRRNRRWSVRPINLFRIERSEFHLLVNDFHVMNDADGHKEYFRMDEYRLKDILRRVGPLLIHRQTHAMPIGPAFRLAFTIKWMASGDSVKHMSKSYRIGYKTAWKIIYETCDALWNVLKPEFLSLPTQDDWMEIAKRFWDRWHFPLCLGAIDGKHVVIKKPPKAGSGFFNFKLDHSVVLLAVADGKYCFSYVDIGQYGRSGDAGVFRTSSFGKALLKDDVLNPMDLPGL